MNNINGIARGVIPCVRAPPSLATEERMLWERSTYEGGVAECMKMCCLGGKNLVVKRLNNVSSFEDPFYDHEPAWPLKPTACTCV